MAAIDFLYSAADLADPGPSLGQRAFLAFTNEAVDEVNRIVLGLMSTDTIATKLLAKDSDLEYVDRDSDLAKSGLQPAAFADAIVSGKAPKVLELKLGCLVIFTRNVNIAAGVANGTKAIVRRISKYRIDVELITGPNTGAIFSCPRVMHKLKTSARGLRFNRLRFPLRLAFALTVHKAQGMTLARCALDLRAHAAHHGCLYTAFSRVRLPQHICVIPPLDGFGPLNILIEKFVRVLPEHDYDD